MVRSFLELLIIILLYYYTLLFVVVILSFQFRRFALFLFFMLSPRWSFVDVPLIFSCPADPVPDWQPPRSISLGMVEARSVYYVKNTQHTVLRGIERLI